MTRIRSLCLALMATAALANPLELANRQAGGCAVMLCPSDTVCTTVNGKSSCVPTGRPCGPVVCGRGLVCCNESCGTCAKPGQACTMQACGVPCGSKLCALGETCCNSSCGYCRKPGEGCTKEFCVD